MEPAFINPTCIIWFLIVCIILAIMYVLLKIFQGPRQHKVTKVKVRKTLLSRMPRVKGMDDNVRTVMTDLLRRFRSNDMKMEKNLTADRADFVQSSSDIKISELEGRVLNGLDISCIVEDSRRIIVAYRKKY